MNHDLGFCLRQDERGDWLYCEDGEERHATLPERVLWKALHAPQAQAAGQEPYTSERHFALREAHEIKAEEEFCAARPSFDSDYARALFNAGYVRGFDKATELAEARAALAQRQPLTVAQVAKLVRSPWGRPDQREVQLVRETEAACAEAWGVKLGATTGEQR